MKQQLIIATRRWREAPRVVANLERHDTDRVRVCAPRFILRSGRM